MTTALYDSLDSLAQGIEEMGGISPERFAKMQHKLPAAASVDRVVWLCARLAGKTILDVGCGGPLHALLQKSCTRAFGLDLEKISAPDCYQLDLDRLTMPLPVFSGVDIVGCFELIEHIGNPRFLLESLRESYPTQELIITTPNAFCDIGRAWMQKGWESVNKDHVAYYSYWTLKTLLEKSGYISQEWYWYNGPVYFAEGLIVTAVPMPRTA